MSDEARNWEYRLSLYYAKTPEDNNVYACKTPRGRTNSVNVIVTGERERGRTDGRTESLRHIGIGCRENFSPPSGLA